MLAIRERGAGPVVVLVHGIPGSAGVWQAVAEHLAISHRVLIPDLVGFGATGGTPPIADLRADAQAKALAAALDRRGISAATVVGHDFGGPILLHLLDRRPDLVAALGLLSANAFPDTRIPFPLVSVIWPVVGPAAARCLLSAPCLRFLTRRMVGAPPVRLDSRTYVGTAAQARAIRLIFADSLNNLAERYGPFGAVMAGVTVPVSVGWGDRDPFFPIAHGHRTAAALGVGLRVFSDAGHALPDERPMEVATMVEELAARARGGRRPTS
ncbi:MAG: alpha/beta fold hydrolase [Candidatus Dormibacteria bacterium]